MGEGGRRLSQGLRATDGEIAARVRERTRQDAAPQTRATSGPKHSAERDGDEDFRYRQFEGATALHRAARQSPRGNRDSQARDRRLEGDAAGSAESVLR